MMLNALNDDEDSWEVLLEQIDYGECTPFLGAGINDGILPLGSCIAEELADEFSYPLDDRSDLAQVSQFIASTRRNWVFPKRRVLRILERELKERQDNDTLPDFSSASDNPLSILANLPLPVYITTNYDDLMFVALDAHPLKEPTNEFCRWNRYIRRKVSISQSEIDFDPTPARPVEARSILLNGLRHSPRLNTFLHGHKDYVRSVSFSPDGKTLASGSSDRTIMLWDVDVESWKERAGRIVNRNLTGAEWKRYLGDEPYRKTFPDLPGLGE